jgi:3-methyladenine DNA glycosylase AlkD
MDTQRIAREIARELAELANPATPAMRAVRRRYSQLLRNAEPGEVVRIATLLVRRCRFVAYELLKEHKAAFQTLTVRQILELGEGLDSWGAVDCFACYVSGPSWRDGSLTTGVIRGWSQSADRWWRRAAVVSTVALSRRGGAEDVRKVVEICALAVPDRDDMVVKALSWALRELSKKHPKEARAFLAQHRSALASLVTREVQCKMDTGLKAPRRRE